MANVAMNETTKRVLVAVAIATSALAVVALVASDGCQDGPAHVDGGDSVDAVDSTASAPSSSMSAAASADQVVHVPTFVLSPEGSTIALSGSTASGKFSARFQRVSARFQMNGNDVVGSSFQLNIEAASLSADTEVTTIQLKSASFLDVDRYTKASFVATNFVAVEPPSETVSHRITGNLTLHGVLKSITFPAVVRVNDETLHITGIISAKRSELGVVGAGQGDDELQDGFRLELDLKLVRTRPTR
jgi:polyisoprenoid-binding protein YceI